jgi:hypothetical protein
MTRSRALLAFAIVTALLTPAVADACPVCFGSAHSALLDSARLGVLAMVGVTLAVLGAFGAFFLRLRRLANAAPTEPESSMEARS